MLRDRQTLPLETTAGLLSLGDLPTTPPTYFCALICNTSLPFPNSIISGHRAGSHTISNPPIWPLPSQGHKHLLHVPAFAIYGPSTYKHSGILLVSHCSPLPPISSLLWNGMWIKQSEIEVKWTMNTSVSAGSLSLWLGATLHCEYTNRRFCWQARVCCTCVCDKQRRCRAKHHC